MNRLVVTVVVLGGLVVLGVLALDQPAPAKREGDVVRARAFELVDAGGRQRAEIKVEDSGEVVLRLRDQDGSIRVKLGADRDGSGLLLLNERTEPGVQALAGERQTGVRVDGRPLRP